MQPRNGQPIIITDCLLSEMISSDHSNLCLTFTSDEISQSKSGRGASSSPSRPLKRSENMLQPFYDEDIVC